MTTLVTGATGFLGSAVARALLARGESIRILRRKRSDTSNLDGLSVDIVDGDLLDPASLKHAVKGCRYVYHVAADYRLWSPDPADMYRANVQGSAALVAAASDAGVERFVYTSSVAAIKPVPNGVADEDTVTHLGDMIGHYKRSKFLAERALASAADAGAPVIIVCPTAPIGPRDIKPTPTGQMILDAANGRMPAYVDTGLNVAHVDDVAFAHLLACERGQVGRKYIAGGRDMTLREILNTVANEMGRRPPSIRLKPSWVIPVGLVNEMWAKLTGKAPRVPLDGVRMAAKHMYFSSQRAIHELGYRARPAEEAIHDALRWFADQGAIAGQ